MSTVNVTNQTNTRNESSRFSRENKMSKNKKMAVTAMLAAIATILMYLSFPVPLMPGFIKLDFSELPALLASYIVGPVAGIAVCFVKNLINLPATTTLGVGELCNFLLGVAFVLPAGLIYKKKRTFKGAILGAVVGCISMAVLSVPINYFISYPAYVNIMGFPMPAIIGEYAKINKNIDSLIQALIIFNVPFTLIKGAINVLLTFLIYKPLSSFIKGNH